MFKLLLMADAPLGGNNPSEAPSGGDFVDGMMSDMSASESKPSAPVSEPARSQSPEPVKEQPKQAVNQPPKANPVKPSMPAAAPKATESALDWKTAPKQFKEAHEKLKSEYETTKKTMESQLQSTRQQMQSFESRKFLTPEQESRYQQLEQRQQQLEADLYSRDYRESPEFKTKYQEKANKVFSTLQNELKSIQVIDNDESRTATMADFAKIRALGDSITEQRRAAKAIFGEDADVVLGLARELKVIEDSANEEIESKRVNWANERNQKLENYKSDFQNTSTAFKNYDNLLVQNYKNFFGPIDDNPQFNDALNKGIEFVDSNASGFNNKSPEERAQSSAIIRRWASSWPANQILIRQQESKIAELESRIQKLQGSDPGSGGESGSSAETGEERGGTDSMMDEIAKLQNQ